MPPDEGIGSPLRRILLPVGDTSGVIEEFRSLYDPLPGKDRLSGRCPAHITIVSPFQSQVGIEKISEWMDLVCKNRLSFGLKAGPAQVRDGWIFLPVKSQQKWLVEAHQKLSKKSGALPDPNYSPHVMLGRMVPAGADPENEKALERELGKLPKSFHLNATFLLLEAIDAAAVSHPLHESHFRM